MTWFESSTNEAEADKAHVLIFVAVDFDFPSGHARFWSGTYPIEINGDTYVGAGELGGISIPSEPTNLIAEKKTYQLSCIDPSLVPESDIDDCFGRSVTEYFGFLNTETRVLVDTPEINWEGRIDSVRRVDGDSPIIEVSAEHRLVLLDRADNWRYTDEHQKQFFSSDVGFNLINTLDGKTVLWGSRRTVLGVHNHGGRYATYDYGD